MSLTGQLSRIFKKTSDYPVLLCGLDGSGKTTLLFKWHTGDGRDTAANCSNLNAATIGVLGGDRITFRDLRSHGGHVAPPRLHQTLHLTSGDLGLLHGGRGVWVVINKQDLLPKEDLAETVAGLEARFEFELNKYGTKVRWHVLHLLGFSAMSGDKVHDALNILARELREVPPSRPQDAKLSLGLGEMSSTQATTKSDQNLPKDFDSFWDAFLHGRVAPWRHMDYLRAAYLTLLQPENRARGLLEVAADFAAKVHSFKQRAVPFQLQPESRTLTVFWMYHVKLAMDSCRVQHGGMPPDFQRHGFQKVLEHMPELMDETLPALYYSPDLLNVSNDSEDYWMLPDLHGLARLPRKADPGLGRQLTLKHQGDPDRILRFVFAVVQRYLRPDSTQRRSWFIDLGFASLEQQTMRLRTMDPSVPRYSMTQSYFYLQLVHVALLQLLGSGKSPQFVQDLSYSAFKDLFHLSPTVWTKFYSQKKWYSLEARAAFVPPDLKPLPDIIDLPSGPLESSSNETYRRQGLIPELPSLEIINFHVAVLLKQAQSLPATIPASSVTSHAALLHYIHTHIISPLPIASLSARAKTHLPLLASSPTLSSTKAAFWLTHALAAARTSSTLPAAPSANPAPSSPWQRYHNCPCHATLLLPPAAGPNPSPVSYPHDYPYDHAPQLTHQCLCHAGEDIDHDAFAALCAEGYARREVWEKRSRGEVPGERVYGDDPWERFVRFNPVLAWEGLWEVFYGRERWEAGGQADRRGWRGEGVDLEVADGDGGGDGDIGSGKEGEERGREEGEGEADIADGEMDGEWEVIGVMG
ncbi:hypothetical protein B0H67DRAFT_555845 [Lasiosphaeris hirsuta]|uniref:Uncharacterized protein n=1 Tax=Lasiosphaeris hirsuta TaxID=260670 RepID=A0AA40AA95_9PEZI|nr:hypothetical protein B0H67DRAFT_555845 [Lasiosphaeris hirsuta]